MHIHDWHATILHLLGLDRERLTCRYAGRDFRLSDVHGKVANENLAYGPELEIHFITRSISEAANSPFPR
jgi:hypothetical protein